MEDNKIPVIAVVGPTASGKTAVGVEIAKHFDGEVVSADSMQIYRELSICTAKPTPAEMDGVPHHMIDIVSVSEEYSAARYCREAAEKINDIYNRGKLTVLVGGTGLYVDSLLNGFDFADQHSDSKLRQSLNEQYDKFGGEYMWNRLAQADSEAANSVHYNNKKRLVRYLELFMLTGLTEKQRSERSKSAISPYRPLYICLSSAERQNLYDRINKRVDEMVNRGLVDEVRRYYEIDNSATSSQAIGCKELRPYLDGNDTLDNCIERLKQATRRYAKRQLTWFTKNEKINLVFTDDGDKYDIINKCLRLTEDFLKGGG